MKTTIVACFLLATATYCDAQVVFTDWTTVDTSANVAVGSLNSASVAFTGSDINFGVTDGSFTGFNFSFFDPPLATSDVVEFKADPSVFAYTISLSLPLTNPRLHLASLGSTLDFSGISLTKLSGQSTFVVSGSTVTGQVDAGGSGFNDSNGTIQLNGTFSSITFTAQAPPAISDGIDMQLGVAVVPEPSTYAMATLCAAALFVSRCFRRGHLTLNPAEHLS